MSIGESSDSALGSERKDKRTLSMGGGAFGGGK